MKIIIETKKKKYRWQPTEWQKALLVSIVYITPIYLGIDYMYY